MIWICPSLLIMNYLHQTIHSLHEFRRIKTAYIFFSSLDCATL